jgi:hypothetical protein
MYKLWNDVVWLVYMTEMMVVPEADHYGLVYNLAHRIMDENELELEMIGNILSTGAMSKN